MVSVANADRAPPAHMTSTWADLSGIRPSMEDSRFPLGRWTAPASAPCSYSSGSRTSSTMVPGAVISASASAVVISRMPALAVASISLKVGTAVSFPRTRQWGQPYFRPPHRPWAALHRVKHYQRGQHSLRPRSPRRGRRILAVEWFPVRSPSTWPAGLDRRPQPALAASGMPVAGPGRRSPADRRRPHPGG